MIPVKQSVSATAAVIAVLAFCAIEAFAQQAAPAWIPFSAKMTEHYLYVSGADTARVELAGYYVRDSHGRSYNRMRIAHYTSRFPLLGSTDYGRLHDRPSHLMYSIDFVKKTVRKEKSYPSTWGTEPQSRQEFDKARAGETFLGKQVISGIECEGYQAPAPHFKKQFNETWYAPSLNFFVVRSRYIGSSGQKQQVETLLEDIHVGLVPDPILFSLPTGFREVR
jgi:hypothetical protein